MREQRFHVFLFIVLAFLIGISQNYIYLTSASRASDSTSGPGFRATDDHVYSYLIGVGLLKSQELKEAQEFFVSHFDESNSTEEFRYRLELRKNYAGNYIFHSAFQYLAGHYLNTKLGIDFSSYPVYLAYAMVTGAVCAYLVALLILIGGLRMMNVSLRTASMFCLTLAIIALADMLPVQGRLDSIMLHGTLLESIKHSFDLMVRPNSQYSLMSFTERANFFLVAFLAFLARNEKKYSAGYWVIVLLCLFHQSLAGLLLMIFVMLDVLLRPSVLRSRKTLVPILIAATAFISRETLWMAIGLERLIPFLAVLLVSIIVLVLARLSRNVRELMTEWFDRLRRVRDIYVLRSGPYADAWLLMLGWTVTWPFGFLIVKAINHFSTYYFWAGVHGRTLTLIIPYLLFCLLHYAFGKVQQRWWMADARIASMALIPILLASTLVVSKAAEHYSRFNVIKQVAIVLSLVDSDLKNKIHGGNSEWDEIKIYYNIAKSLDTGSDQYRQIVPTRP